MSATVDGNIEVGVENLTIEDKNVDKVDTQSEETKAEKTDENLTIEDAGKCVLGEKNENVEILDENSCGFCKKADAGKRCSKRHPKCLKKLFCNETCEAAAHKKKVTPEEAAKASAKKAAEKKKKAITKAENLLKPI